jgi:ribonucleotide reductase alpha subunit
MNLMVTYTPAEVFSATLKYFQGDELATKAWINKSALRNKQDELIELTPDDRLKTIASEVARIESNYPNPLREEEIYEALKGMKNVVFQGSPVYGIGNPYTYSMLSNCTAIESPVDSVSGIMKTALEMANLFKVRAGVGVDISSLRPENAYVNNSAKTSTGAWSFADLYSHVTQAIGQAGRRGACILLMAIKHPDIYKFATMKRDLSKCTGANISLKVFDDFMQALQSDDEYTLQWPVDSETPSITKTIKAKHLWDVIITEALERAEPGIAFWDRHINYNPSSVYEQLRPFALNPCLTGDTIISTYSQGDKTFKELAEKGEDVEVECWDFKEQTFAIKVMRNPRKTGENQKIVKVNLEGFGYNEKRGDYFDQGSIKCTLDHKFFLMEMSEELHYFSCSGKEIKAKDLIPGMAIVGGTVADELETELQAGLKVKSIEFLEEPENVYNGTVDDFHNYCSKSGNLLILNRNCGEQALPKDSCRLISYNLKHIADWRAVGSDYHLTVSEEERIKKYVRVAVRLADDMVDLEFEKLQRLMDKSWKDNDKDAWYLWKDFMDTGKLGRRVGLSIHGLADLLARLGIRYDSNEALDIVGKVFSLIRDTAYKTSIQLAKERGAFPLFDWELEKNNEYIRNLPEGIKDELKLHGRRNVCLLTCAPAGTVSILSQTSSGIEPVFANEYVRKCRINDNDPTEGKKIITHEDGGKFFEYTVYHKNLEEWKELNPNQPIPDFFVEAGKIDWLKRIQLQGIIQHFVDASISSTLNCAKGTTKETISQIYIEAWKHGLKGVTVYVDGSREGILNHVVKEEPKEEVFGYKEAPKRPEVLECDIHYTQIGKEEWIVLVGLWNGKPYEIFGGHAKDIIIPRKLKKAHIIKRRFKSKNSEYDLYLERATENEQIVRNVSTMFENKTYGVLGRLISLGLRHGCKPTYLQEQLFKDTDFDFLTYNKVMGRILKKYIEDGEQSSDKCTECGATLIYESGCAICRSCGFSKCN